MGSMKSMLGMYAMAAAMAGGIQTPSSFRYVDPRETEEERQLRLIRSKIRRNEKNGLKEFFYGDNSLWARDQKNADRKAKNKNWV
jgi:hypothetical protein